MTDRTTRDQIEQTIFEEFEAAYPETLRACAVNATQALLAAGLVVPAGLTAEKLLRRFAENGYEVGISPLLPTSPDWRISVHDTRSGTSRVQYGPSLVDALAKGAVAVSLVAELRETP